MRRRWHRRPRTPQDLRRLARKAGLSCAWLALSIILQVGALTLIWELTFPLLATAEASRTGFFAGMQAPRRPLIPPPEIPARHEPELLPPEEPPIPEVDPLEEPEGAAEVREKLIEYAAPEWEPEETDETALIAFSRVTGIGGAPATGDGHRPLRAVRPDGDADRAVALGLRWLASHQDVDEDGRWDGDGFMKHDPFDDRCDGAGAPLYDVGVTGLALLAFLETGHTGRATRGNPYARNVRRGLRFLMRSQGADGTLGPRAARKFIYNHAIATVALCEAFWRTRNPRYERPAQRALDFIARARNPYMAWRYVPRGGENDTAVTTWCVLALRAGRRAGLAVDPDAFEGARQWIRKMTDPEFGQVGYNFPGGHPSRPEALRDRFPAEKSQAMTAAGILCRLALGEDPRASELIRKGAGLCVELPPCWNPDDGSIDMYYWYFATRAIDRVGGAYRRKWREHARLAVLKSQHAAGSGARAGSWDPIGVHGDEGGRIYATALMVGTLPSLR